MNECMGTEPLRITWLFFWLRMNWMIKLLLVIARHIASSSSSRLLIICILSSSSEEDDEDEECGRLMKLKFILRENFWANKVVGIACSLQWQTWSSSVIYRKLSQNWLRSVRILESMRHCIVKSVQNRMRSMRILESMCQCIVKSVQNWKMWESWNQCVIVLSNPFRIDWKTWESLN